MFTDSNVFKFTNFPFKTKYTNTVVYSVNRKNLFSRGKQEKKNSWDNSLIKSIVYLLKLASAIFYQIFIFHFYFLAILNEK